jgi:hypothetical protein
MFLSKKVKGEKSRVEPGFDLWTETRKIKQNFNYTCKRKLADPRQRFFGLKFFAHITTNPNSIGQNISPFPFSRFSSIPATRSKFHRILTSEEGPFLSGYGGIEPFRSTFVRCG